MKLSKTVLLLIMLIPFFAISQEIHFSYDAAGNRVQRMLTTIVCKTSVTHLKGDSTKQIKDDETAEAEMKVKVFPNPSQDMINIDVGGITDEDDNVYIFLYDAIGKEVYSSLAINSVHQINVSNYKPANYHLKVVRGDKFVIYNVVKN